MVTIKDNISMGGHRITNLADPATHDEPATKGYTDMHYSGGTRPQGPQGPKGDIGNRGPKGDQADLGPQGDRGLVGQTGARGTQGVQGPKGDTSQRGPVGPAGTFGGTVSTNVNMAGHKLYGLPTPTQDSDAVTKKWVIDDFPTKSNERSVGYEWTQDLRGMHPN